MSKIFSKTVLPNGMRVVSERVSSVASISVGVWVHVGSRDEPEKMGGVSHFIEHMLFKGTPKRSPFEIAKAVESLGGSINAFTSRENTCFYVRTQGKNLKQAMEILGDILNNSLFKPDDLRKERQVILEEIKDVADSPGELVHDLFVEQMFKTHPLGRPIMGKADSVNSLRRPSVLDFKDKNYTSPNLLVSATGAINHKELVDLTRKYFKWPKLDTVDNEAFPEAAPFSIASNKNGTQQTHICMGFPNFKFSDPMRYAISAINTYLSSGMSARLFQKVREEYGYCYSIYGYQEFFRDTGLFCVYFGSDRKYVIKASNIVLKELNRLKEKLLNRADVTKIKEQLKGNLLLSQESMYNRMNRIAVQELVLNSYTDLETNCKVIDKINASQMREAANMIFNPEYLTYCALGPIQQEELEKIRWSSL